MILSQKQRRVARRRDKRWILSGLLVVAAALLFAVLANRLMGQLAFRKAVNELRAQRPGQARTLLEGAVRRCPGDAGIWKALGDARHMAARSLPLQQAAGLFAAAAEAFQRATLLNPLDAEAFYRLARETALLEQFPRNLTAAGASVPLDAKPYFEQALARRPHSIFYHFEFVRYLSRRGLSADVETTVTRMVRLYPPIYNNLKREAFWSPKARDAAARGMHQALADGTDPRGTHLLLAGLMASVKNWSAAAFHCEKALAIMPGENTAANYFHLGNLYLQDGRTKAAENAFLHGLLLSQNIPKTLESVYHTYRRLGYTAFLEPLFQRVSLEVGHVSGLRLLTARMLIDLEHYDQARRILEDINRERPDAEAFYSLYRIAQLQKDPDAMELAIQKATVYDPSNERYHLLFSQTLMQMKKYKSAEAAVGRAIRHARRPSANLYAQRAGIRWQLEEYAGAAADWQQAAELDARRADWYYRAAEARLKNGEAAAALENYKKALELAPDNTTYRKKYEVLKSISATP